MNLFAASVTLAVGTLVDPAERLVDMVQQPPTLGAVGERQFALRRGMRQPQFALQSGGQQGMRRGSRRPAAVVQPHDPQMVEAQAAGLQRPQYLHGGLAALRLEQGVAGQAVVGRAVL